MEQKTLTASPRNELKKGASGRLRRAGKIPGIVYGHSGTTPVTVDAHEFSKQFKQVSGNTIISLAVGKTKYDVLVKDYQTDIITGGILHIDFYEIEQGKELRASIPIHLTGSAIGVREGGLLEQLLHEVEVSCLPKDIPDAMTVDISELVIGSAVHVSDLPVSDGVRILASPEQVVVLVAAMKEEKLEAEEEEVVEGEEAAEGEEAEAPAEEKEQEA